MQLIAEIGVNHEGRLDLAKKMIDLLAQTNCQIVKFQTYKAEYLASKDAKAYWDTSKENIENQRQLFSKYDNFEIRDYIFLAEYAADRNIEFMTTFFDTRTLDSLAKYVKRFKIASADLTNFELVNKL
jgi:sialic acid synthase SpsE